MKFLYVVPLIFAITLGYKLVDFEYKHAKQTSVLKEKVVEQFGGLIEKLAAVKTKDALFDSSSANLNDYLDLLLPQINEAISAAGYDPTDLPDESINIVIGTSTLTEGTLTKLATIERYENVTVTYDSEAKKVDLEFILRWEDLELIYKYHTKVVLISITGHVTANVEHMKIHLKLGFDFNANQVTVDSLDFKHTGDITLKFSGNGLIDYITNAMTEVFTTILHNLIISIVKKVAMDPVQDIVDAINLAIDNILHPSSGF